MTTSAWSEVWGYTKDDSSGETDLSKIMSHWSFAHGTTESPASFYSTGVNLSWEDNVPQGLTITPPVSRCAKEHVTKGQVGGMGWTDERTTEFSQWGEAFNKRAPVLYDEVWVRVWQYWPTNWDASTTNGLVGSKNLRLGCHYRDTNAYGGYLNFNTRLEQTDPPRRDYCISDEGQAEWGSGHPGAVWPSDNISGKQSLFRGDWNCIEFYVKLDPIPVDNGGTGRIIYWKNGIRFADITDRPTFMTGDFYVRRPLWLQNVQNDPPGAPQDQDIWVSNWSTAIKAAGWRDDTAHMARDAEGFPFIGLACTNEIGTVIPPPGDNFDRILSGTIHNGGDLVWDGWTAIDGNLTVSGSTTITFPAGSRLSMVGDGDVTFKLQTGVWLYVNGVNGNPVIFDTDGSSGKKTVDGRYGQFDLKFLTAMSGINVSTTNASNPSNARSGYNSVGEDCVFIDAGRSDFYGHCRWKRSIFYTSYNIDSTTSPGNTTVTGPGSTTGLATEPSYEDCVFINGTWITRSLMGWAKGCVFISQYHNGGQNEHTHEHLYPVSKNTAIEDSIFIGPSYAAIMWAGGEGVGVGNSRIKNNTIDKKDQTAAFQFYRLTADSVGDNFRNNAYVRAGRVYWKATSPDNTVTFDYEDYNALVNITGQVYDGVTVAGKNEGDPGWGGNNIVLPDLYDEFVDPDWGWPFPYTSEQLLTRQVTTEDVINSYRAAYTPKAGSSLIGAGDPADGSPNIGAV